VRLSATERGRGSARAAQSIEDRFAASPFADEVPRLPETVSAG
jgi:hypothetical protein